MIGLGLAIPSLSTLGNPLNTIYAAVLAMFAGGAVPGVFLDANDWGPTGTNGTGVVFQDMTGTPVTAMEQPVQLILDKSQGLALGPELVTNGDFSSAIGWSLAGGGVGQSITGGKLVYTNATNLGAYQSILTTGCYYECTFTIDSISAGGVRFSIGTSSKGITRTTPGTYTEQLFCYGATIYFQLESVGSTTCVIDNASCKKIAGDHAWVPASANRPIITARYNLYTKTESIKDWATSNCTVDPTPVAGPDGKVVAYRATFAANGLLYQNAVPATGSIGSFTQIAYVKSATGSNQTIRQFGNGVTTFSSNITVGTSWQPISFAFAFSSATSGFTTASGGTADILICYPDIRPSDQATGLIPTYQRVNTPTDYDWSPAFPPMIKGNGSNQYLTGNLDLSSTNKVTVWAGVRKFSDAAGGMIFELTASANANPGSLYLAAPVTAAANVQYASKGTVLADVLTTGVAAPKTMVLTGRSDISAPLVSLSINGTAATSSATQGTGNFSNAAFYVLSRAGASLFSSGGFNTIIILGAAATAAQISTTKAWANSKVRAY